MRIYIVFVGSYEYRTIKKIYAKKENAEKYKAKYLEMHEKRRNGYLDEFDCIDEYDIGDM